MLHTHACDPWCCTTVHVAVRTLAGCVVVCGSLTEYGFLCSCVHAALCAGPNCVNLSCGHVCIRFNFLGRLNYGPRTRTNIYVRSVVVANGACCATAVVPWLGRGRKLEGLCHHTTIPHQPAPDKQLSQLCRFDCPARRYKVTPSPCRYLLAFAPYRTRKMTREPQVGFAYFFRGARVVRRGPRNREREERTVAGRKAFCVPQSMDCFVKTIYTMLRTSIQIMFSCFFFVNRDI